MEEQTSNICLQCGEILKKPRKLKDFCTYSCRGQHVVNTLPGVPRRGAYKGSKNLKQNRALHTLKRQSLGAITFCKINSVTYRIDRRGKNGVGWLMEVAWPGGASPDRWVACVGNHRSEPLPLTEAKETAKALLTCKGKAEPRNRIKELNQLAANEVDGTEIERERRSWPLDFLGGQRHRRKKPSLAVEPAQRQVVLSTELLNEDKPRPERLNGDHVQLEYYDDGYPKLPARLDRREE